jgi:hypothetical protein
VAHAPEGACEGACVGRALTALSRRDTCVHRLQLQWELGSPVFGFLLRKYAPHDTYQVLHRGCTSALRHDAISAGHSFPD